jgi:uncharacterized protein with beta-barrel porin domain
MVTPTGKAAVLFEHSMIDGTVTLRYADRVASVNSTEISDEAENEATIAPAVSDVFADAFAEMAESGRSEIASLEEQGEYECVSTMMFSYSFFSPPLFQLMLNA